MHEGKKPPSGGSTLGFLDSINIKSGSYDDANAIFMVLFDRGENFACFLFFGFPKSIILSKVMVDILVLELLLRMGKLDQSPNFKISARGEIL